jgi:uridine kinase
MVDIEAVAAEILARPNPNGVRLVGVDGHGGTGKTTLARELAGRLSASSIEIDDFLSWVDLTGWWPRFEEQVLRPLLAGKDARYQARDWVNDEFGAGLGDWKTAIWTPVVVIEGIGSTRRAIADRLTYAIWVEAPVAVRLARGIDRDGESHRSLWLRQIEQDDEFFAADNTRARADLIVDTSGL